MSENKKDCPSCTLPIIELKGEDLTVVKLTNTAEDILNQRYLIKDENRNVIETPEQMFKRVAKVISLGDKKLEESFYNMMIKLDFLPNSPTLMNAGTDLGQLSACFVIPVEDNMESIMGGVYHAAMIHKSGGGTGFDFSKLRPKGDVVKKTGGIASGPLSFMTIYDVATGVIKQGGKRRGANMGILRVDHPDIFDFLVAKENEGVLSNFNLSVAITDKFMKAVKNNSDFDLINPRTKKVHSTVKARSIWNLLVTMTWKNGEPAIIFIDTINKYNPLREVLGDIEATNPCAEQPLYSYESCNLGSINLSNMVFTTIVDKKVLVDKDKLETTTRLAVRFLDNVIDCNHFPLPEIAEMTKKTRRIGIGVMGFADMLIKMKIKYNSPEAILIANQVMKTIDDTARDESCKIGEEKGDFPLFKDTPLVKTHPHMRNATLTTIAPTGSISMIAGVSSGIEPLFDIQFIKDLSDSMGQKYTIKHPLYSEETKEYFVTALQLTPEQHIHIQSAFQKHVDNAVSKCLVGEHLLNTSKGIIRIKECGYATGNDKFDKSIDGLEVLDSFNNRQKILRHYSAGSVPARKIILKSGAIIEGSKKTHRIQTTNGWTILEEVTTNDLIRVKRRFAPINTLGHKKLLPIGELNTNSNNIKVPDIMSIELAKWLGMVAADSCCSLDNGHVGIVVGKGKKEAKELFSELTLKLFGEHVISVPDKRHPYTESIFITSRAFCRWVLNFIGGSSNTRHIPKEILEGSRDERKSFIEGLTLDGYYGANHGLIVYEGMSERLAYEVSESLRAEGVPRVTIHHKKTPYGITTGVCVSNELQEIIKAIESHKNREIIYKDQLVEINPHEVRLLKLPVNDYRYSILRYLKQSKRNYCYERVARNLGLTIVSELEKVRTIEDTRNKDMYDVEIEESHEYIVNGIISHNTINLPKSATIEDVEKAYLYAYTSGCKGVAMYRNGSREKQIIAMSE